MDKIEIAENQQIFEDHLFQLNQQWLWFSEHETKFTNVRDKHLAHLDVSKVGDKYERTEVASLEWKLVVEALKRLIEITNLLAAILGNESRDFDQFVRQAQRDANDFWQIS